MGIVINWFNVFAETLQAFVTDNLIMKENNIVH